MEQLTFRTSPLFFVYTLIILTACSETGHQPPGASGQTTVLVAQDCTSHVIAQDDSLGSVRNHACETIPLAETIRNYADAMERLDYSGCPPTFAAAFKKHREAWRQMIPFVEKHADLRGEMHDLFDGLEKGEHAEEFKPLLKAVWDTWGEVEAAMK